MEDVVWVCGYEGWKGRGKIRVLCGGVNNGEGRRKGGNFMKPGRSRGRVQTSQLEDEW